jgi:hypothetical protein
MNTEQALFAAFAIPVKRERYVELLGTKRGRDKVRDALDHFHDLDPRFCRKVAPKQASPDAVLSALRGLGAPIHCYVFSADSELDRRKMPLSDALQNVIGMSVGTFISCIDGILGFFQGEEPGESYICHRNP